MSLLNSHPFIFLEIILLGIFLLFLFTKFLKKKFTKNKVRENKRIRAINNEIGQLKLSNGILLKRLDELEKQQKSIYKLEGKFPISTYLN
jgi:hypothetical protein